RRAQGRQGRGALLLQAAQGGLGVKRSRRGDKMRARAAKAAKASLRAKPKPKGKRKGKEDDASPVVPSEIPGLLLISLLLVTLLSLVSQQVSPEANLLGPYLGAWWADTLNKAFGKLPVLFHLAALGLV